MKYGIIGLAIVIVVLLILLLTQNGGDNNSPAKEPVPADSTTVSTPAPDDNGKQQVSPVTESSQSDTPQQAASSNQTDKPQTTTGTSVTNQATSQPAAPSVQKNYLDLGYAEWRGPVKNGKPNGDGIMKFKSSHRIDSRDPSGNVAEAGDYIDGTYVNGHLDQGTWHKAGGGSEYLLIGQ